MAKAPLRWQRHRLVLKVVNARLWLSRANSLHWLGTAQSRFGKVECVEHGVRWNGKVTNVSSCIGMATYCEVLTENDKKAMKKNRGHWFCDHCDDVVFMSYEGITKTDVPCPVCGHLACNFVPQRLNRKTIAADWFDAMRRAVDEATNPELPDMRHHKERL